MPRAFRPYLEVEQAEIVLVIGPPCSGKSSLVAERKKPDDLVFDFDRIAEALTSSGVECHGGWSLGVRAFVLAMRDAFIVKAERASAGVRRVWIVASKDQPSLPMRATRIYMNTPRLVCLERASARGPEQLRMVEQWFRENP